MPHPDHDAIVQAFQRADASADVTHFRGAPKRGYTHIHGPNQPRHDTKCTNHTANVEMQNGTVGLRHPLGEKLGGEHKVEIPIGDDDMGYSTGPNHGLMGIAFTPAMILARWASYDDFAKDVIDAAKKHLDSW